MRRNPLLIVGLFVAACAPAAPQAPPTHKEQPRLVGTVPTQTNPTERSSGRVVGVHDRDTPIVLAPGNVELKLRMATIDATECKQLFGQQSKQTVSGE